MLHQADWPQESMIPQNGFFGRECTLLSGNNQPCFGFAACHYDRYLLRLQLGESAQAEDDLTNAISLGFEPDLPHEPASAGTSQTAP
jgi:hypothetical protein